MTRKIYFTALALALSAGAQAQKDTTTMRTVVVEDMALTRQEEQRFSHAYTGLERETLTENERQNVLPTLSEKVPGLLVSGRGMMGFGVSSGAAGGIGIRGLSSGNGQVLVVIDGIPQYQSLFGHSLADAYQTTMVEKVEVMRGPASFFYGSNAMGGVIQLTTRHQKEDGTKVHLGAGAGSWGTVQADGSLQTQSGNFSATVSGQYGRSDNHRPNMGFEQFGGFAKVGYHMGDHWTATVLTDLTRFIASYPGTENKPMLEADQWITRGSTNLALDHHHSKADGSLTIFDNYGWHKINDGYAAEGGKPQSELFRSTDHLAGIKLSEAFRPADYTTIKLSADYKYLYGHAWYTSRETGEVVTTGRRGMQSTDSNDSEVGGSVSIRQGIIRDLLWLDASLRYNHHSRVGNEWAPYVGLGSRLAGGMLMANVSKGFRNPTMKEMYLYGSKNPELKPERMWNYELSWQQLLLNKALSYSLSVFVMDGENMIQTVVQKNADGSSSQKNINTGEFLNKGIELEASWRLSKHLSLSTNHSYIHTDTHLMLTPTYKGYLGANVHLGRWTATAGLQHVNGLYTSIGTDDDPKESFTLLNATVGYQLTPVVRLWAKGDNLLAQRYEYMAGMPMPRATFMAGVNIDF